MSLIFNYAVSESQRSKEASSHEIEESRANVGGTHKRLWRSIRERLEEKGKSDDIEGLKLLKAYADILSVITKTERLIWSIEEKAEGKEEVVEDEIAEAMAQITFPQRAGETAGGE